MDLEFLKAGDNAAAAETLSARLCEEVIPALSGALRKIEGKFKNPPPPQE